MSRFKEFTDEEIYILFRAFMESSYEFNMTDKYSKEEADIHTKILNELLEERK